MAIDLKAVEEKITPILDELEAELVDLVFSPKRKSEPASLTVYVYKKEGVDLDLLEKAHRKIDVAIDDIDFTNGESYTLNVSSPGLDRPLKTDRDLERNLGVDLEVKLYEKLNGKKLIVGTLVSFDKDAVTLSVDGTETKFERNKIAKLSQAIFF